MAQSKALEVWSGLPTWAKGIIAIGGVAILYFTSRTIIKKISSVKESKDVKELTRDAKSDRTALLRKGLRPTFSETQYKGWANAIEQAFEGCSGGTITWGKDSPLGNVTTWSTAGYKVATIFNQLKNDLDFIDLVIAWGVRTYDKCGILTGDVVDADLFKAITNDLTDRERRDVNTILAKKRITYKV